MARLRGRVERLRRIQRKRHGGRCPVCRGVGRLNVLIHKPVGCEGCGEYRCTWIVPAVDENGELIDDGKAWLP